MNRHHANAMTIQRISVRSMGSFHQRRSEGGVYDVGIVAILLLITYLFVPNLCRGEGAARFIYLASGMVMISMMPQMVNRMIGADTHINNSRNGSSSTFCMTGKRSFLSDIINSSVYFDGGRHRLLVDFRGQKFIFKNGLTIARALFLLQVI